MDKTAAAAVVVILSAFSAQAGEVHKGMTEAQVLRQMGQPNQQSELNGHEQWIYMHMTPMSAFLGQFSLRGGPDVLSLTFNHGRVASIEHDR